MTTEPPTETHAESNGTQTERVLYDFVRDAVQRLSTDLNDSAPEFADDIRLERGADASARARGAFGCCGRS